MPRLLFCISLASLSAVAQLTAVVTERPDGRSQMTITNYSKARLEALVVSWISPIVPSGSGHALLYRDALLQHNFKPLIPGAQTILPLSGDNVTQAEARAAIFQDGSTFGDPEWVDVLRKRRSHYLQAVDAFLAILEDPANRNMTPDALVQQLTASRNKQLAAAGIAAPPIRGTSVITPELINNGNWRQDINLVFGLIARPVSKPSTKSDGSVVAQSEVVGAVVALMKEQRNGLLAAAVK